MLYSNDVPMLWRRWNNTTVYLWTDDQWTFNWLCLKSAKRQQFEPRDQHSTKIEHKIDHSNVNQVRSNPRPHALLCVAYLSNLLNCPFRYFALQRVSDRAVAAPNVVEIVQMPNQSRQKNWMLSLMLMSMTWNCKQATAVAHARYGWFGGNTYTHTTLTNQRVSLQFLAILIHHIFYIEHVNQTAWKHHSRQQQAENSNNNYKTLEIHIF